MRILLIIIIKTKWYRSFPFPCLKASMTELTDPWLAATCWLVARAEWAQIAQCQDLGSVFCTVQSIPRWIADCRIISSDLARFRCLPACYDCESHWALYLNPYSRLLQVWRDRAHPVSRLPILIATSPSPTRRSWASTSTPQMVIFNMNNPRQNAHKLIFLEFSSFQFSGAGVGGNLGSQTPLAGQKNKTNKKKGFKQNLYKSGANF